MVDLTPILTIDRHVRLPLSKWRGHGDESLFCGMGEVGLQVNVWVEDALASPPWEVVENILYNQLIILGVSANPEPYNAIRFFPTERAIPVCQRAPTIIF